MLRSHVACELVLVIMFNIATSPPSLDKLFHGLIVSDIWESLLCDPPNSNAHQTTQKSLSIDRLMAFLVKFAELPQRKWYYTAHYLQVLTCPPVWS